MTTVYFVRHAKPNYDNHDDLARELTAEGLRDSRLVEDFFADKEIHAMYSSPCRRTLDTLAGTAVAHGLEIQTVEGFRERNIGDVWVENFPDYVRAQWEDFDYKLPGGESLRETQTRNIQALRMLLRANPEETVVVGGHGTALSTIIQFYDNTFGFAGFRYISPRMPHIVRLGFVRDTCVEIRQIDLFAKPEEYMNCRAHSRTCSLAREDLQQ